MAGRQWNSRSFLYTSFLIVWKKKVIEVVFEWQALSGGSLHCIVKIRKIKIRICNWIPRLYHILQYKILHYNLETVSEPSVTNNYVTSTWEDITMFWTAWHPPGCSPSKSLDYMICLSGVCSHVIDSISHALWDPGKCHSNCTFK